MPDKDLAAVVWVDASLCGACLKQFVREEWNFCPRCGAQLAFDPSDIIGGPT